MKKYLKKITPLHAAYTGIAVSIILYVLSNNWLFGVSTFLALLYVFYVEFVKQKNPLNETLNSLAFALGVWMAISFLLNTTSPINIITSCSMLPNLDRGDVIILQGLPEYNAGQEFLEKDISTLDYAPALVRGGNSTSVIVIPTDGGKPLFSLKFKECTRQKAGQQYDVICFDSLAMNDQHWQDFSNDVIVYESDTPAGYIIHRALLKINTPNNQYFLSQGDNNPFPDQISGIPVLKRQQMRQVVLNIPFVAVIGLDKNNSVIVSRENDLKIKGRVLARIPYLGYAKLFLFMQFNAPEGCDTTFVKKQPTA